MMMAAGGRVIPPFGTIDSSINNAECLSDGNYKKQQLKSDLQHFLSQQALQNPRLKKRQSVTSFHSQTKPAVPLHQTVTFNDKYQAESEQRNSQRSQERQVRNEPPRHPSPFQEDRRYLFYAIQYLAEG